MSDIQLGFKIPPVPDAIFPSDNDLGIPTLDAKLQAKFLYLPFEKWGDKARSSRMPGTYHFYTDDYKFNALWHRPNTLIRSQCKAIIEPNFSLNDQMPVAVALWQIYRKRWLARYYQNYGIEIFVDLNVTPTYDTINLYGIPTGWRAYCTRSLNIDIELLDNKFTLATEKAESDDILFIVAGGGKIIYEKCKSSGWIWIPENIQRKEKRKWVQEAVAAVEQNVVAKDCLGINRAEDG